MSVIINTNMAATIAATNLGNANAQLQTALTQLSSGSKITSPADDAGGLAVSMQLTASIGRSNATNTNVQNANSFLQTQDGALSTVANILNRMSELKTMSLDVTKNSADIADYNTEFNQLQTSITSISSAQFNGVNLFGGTSLTVSTTEDGGSSGDVTINQSNLAADSNVSTVTGATDLSGVTTQNLNDAISSVANMRATNGAETSSLNFASSLLTTNTNNLTAANSQITDVDVAQASTALAKDNIMVQAGTSMLAQANSSTQAVLKLLQ